MIFFFRLPISELPSLDLMSVPWFCAQTFSFSKTLPSFSLSFPTCPNFLRLHFHCLHFYHFLPENHRYSDQSPSQKSLCPIHTIRSNYWSRGHFHQHCQKALNRIAHLPPALCQPRHSFATHEYFSAAVLFSQAQLVLFASTMTFCSLFPLGHLARHRIPSHRSTLRLLLPQSPHCFLLSLVRLATVDVVSFFGLATCIVQSFRLRC